MTESVVSRPRVLFVTPVCPSEPDSGGLQVSFERLAALAKNADVSVVAMVGSEGGAQYLKSSLGIKDIRYEGNVRPRTLTTWATSLVRGYPLSVWRNMNPAFIRLCDELRDQHWDYVYADHWLVWPAVRAFRPKKILHLHNAEHALFSRAAEGKNWFLKKVLQFEAMRAARFLAKASKEADELHLLSPADEQELGRAGVKSKVTHVFLPSVGIPAGQYGNHGKELLFAGTLTWVPNQEGIHWFLKHVQWRLGNELVFRVIGGVPTHALRALTTDTQGCTVEWLGRVPSVEPYYETASVFVAPLLSGSGIKIKILNALSHGLPVVTTSIGIEGFPDGWGKGIAVADSPSAFAEAIKLLINDQEGWDQARRDARAYIQRYFVGGAFEQWCVQLVGGPEHE